MKWPNWILILLAGGVGGVAPNLFRVGTQLQAGQSIPDVTYLIGMLIFFGLGGATAVALGEVEGKKAFFLGLSLPALMQSGIQDLSATATAQAAQSLERAQGSIFLYFESEAPEWALIWNSADRKQREQVTYTDGAPKGRLVADPPDWATSFQVFVPDSKSKPSAEKSIAVGAWDVRITRAPLRGFKQAVGIRGAAEWNISVEEHDEKSPGRGR